MHRRASSLRSTCWVAAVAILMLALAPAISAVLRGANYAAWVNVCRTASVAAPASSAAGQGAADDMAHPNAHCPYCALHADTLPPAPRTLDIPRDVLPAFKEPQAFLQAPTVGHLWRHAPSRAPPRLS